MAPLKSKIELRRYYVYSVISQLEPVPHQKLWSPKNGTDRQMSDISVRHKRSLVLLTDNDRHAIPQGNSCCPRSTVYTDSRHSVLREQPVVRDIACEVPDVPDQGSERS
jgi:hypothetical protein